jgi:hypothetical protein
MPNQIVLSWDVDVSNTTFGPAQAAAALGAVPLYQSAASDPVLGQKFGLTVASDVTSIPGGGVARRTLTLNMDSTNTPTAPPPFPCHPITASPPTPPYPLRSTRALPGSFFVSNGATNIPTTATQVPSLAVNDVIQFLSQPGVFYTVASVSSTAIGLSGPYTGTSGNSEAFKQIPAPVSIAAIYSTSDLDTAGVATVPAIPAGSGARTVAITYTDSAGATGRSATASLTGKRPAAIAFTNGNGVISAIESISIATSGGFGNSIGQITLVELISALPAIPADATPGTGIGAGQGDRTFKALTDQAQLLIGRTLAYLPPSYFSLAQQGAAAPQLSGDFIVTTGSASVPTSTDQTGALAASNVIEFADQQGTLYVIASVTPKIVTLSTPYTGIDTTNTGLVNTGTNNNAGTKGNVGEKVYQKPTGATLVSPSPAASPTNAQLASPLAQFVDPGVAASPPNPPLNPATMTPPVTAAPGAAPNFLSGLFTVTLQLALAVPVVPRAITFV